MGRGAKRVFEDEFQLHYITRGQGTLFQGSDQELKLDAGSVFFLIPRVPHSRIFKKRTGRSPSDWQRQFHP